MNKILNFKNIFFLIIVCLLFRIPLLLMGHIQEDAFITWRVGKNLLDYGVIGFNGIEKISASTTHLYVFISSFFQFLFGNHFIYPILIFSSILFTIGTILISEILFSNNKNIKNQILFILLINIIPPSLTSSVLGMEYGILFFLYSCLFYFGIFKEKKWAFYIFPILILWTRIDTVIFLGITFLICTFYTKKINFSFIIGGIIGLVSVLLFNYFYFGEIVNHTITSKKIAYPNNDGFSFSIFISQLSYYGGFIKKNGTLSIVVFFLFLFLCIYSFSKIIKNKENFTPKKIVFGILLLYPIIKLIIFVYSKAYFDWYYWIPRIFLTIIILYYFIVSVFQKKIYTIALSIIFLGFYSFQILQSSAISYMENEQRKKIADDLIQENVSEKNSIFLEPAGKIPFYTNMKTYDDVGLVNYEVTNEMVKDFPNFWMNFVRDYHPDYILVIGEKPNLTKKNFLKNKADSIFFNQNYLLKESYPIDDIYTSAPNAIRFVYKIRAIGKDYHLYKKILK